MNLDNVTKIILRIKIEEGIIGSGVLWISKESFYVFTAAHVLCKNNTNILISDIFILEFEDKDVYLQEKINSGNIYFNDYKITNSTITNDIAVIKFLPKEETKKHFENIKSLYFLPKEFLSLGKKVVLVGFPSVSFKSSSCILSKVYKEAKIASAVDGGLFNIELDDKTNSNNDKLEGFSGGGIFLNDNNKKIILIGIYSGTLTNDVEHGIVTGVFNIPIKELCEKNLLEYPSFCENLLENKLYDDEYKSCLSLINRQISIAIKSFEYGAEELENKSDNCLSFINKFSGRNLKDQFEWDRDIFEKLEEFLLKNTKTEHSYKIFLDTHSSIAFSAGRILNTKMGINIFPIQKTLSHGLVLWDLEKTSENEYSNWNISNNKLSEDNKDTILILSVTRNIELDVKRYLKENNLAIGRIINCTISKYGATNFSIKDGFHASMLANLVYNALSVRTTLERQNKLHIFSAAPNGFMFFLGQISLGFGKCILYEYDFQQENTCSYTQSIKFIK